MAKGMVMRQPYDFSSSRKNPYAAKLKRPVTIRLDEESISYFKFATPCVKSWFATRRERHSWPCRDSLACDRSRGSTTRRCQDDGPGIVPPGSASSGA